MKNKRIPDTAVSGILLELFQFIQKFTDSV